MVIPTNEAAMPSWEKKTSKHAGSPFRSWGYAGSFDGIDDYIECPSMRFTNTAPWTLEAWAYVREFSTSGTYWAQIIGIKATSGLSISVDGRGGNEVTLWVAGHTVFGFPSPALMCGLQTDKWYHFLAVYDGSDGYSFYLNGSRVATATKALTYDCDDLIRLGYGDMEHLNGIVALARIYNSALSGDEVQALYSDPQNPPLDGLVLWLDKDTWDWESGKWRDKSGHGNHGIIYGVSRALPPLEAKFYESKVMG